MIKENNKIYQKEWVAIHIECIFVFARFSWIYLDSIVSDLRGKKFVVKGIGLVFTLSNFVDMSRIRRMRG